MKRLPTLLLSLAFLGLAPAALADKVEEARARFQRGVELYREGSFDAALAEFNKAYDLAPNYRVLYNMAQVQSERHDYVAALKLLEKYLEEGGGDIAPERKDQVTKEIATLRGRVTELKVSTNVEGAELLIDGVVSGTTPFTEPVLISAGVRQLQLRKTGYETANKTMTVAGGDEVAVEFELTELPESSSGSGGLAVQTSAMPTQDSRPVDDRPSKAPMWITLASTGLLAGGAVTFAVITKKADDELERELNKMPLDQDRVTSKRDDVKRNALLTDGFTAASVISAGLFVYFAISTSKSSSSDAKTTTTANVRIAPSPTSLHVIGNF
jgi:PEGA domain/Tetratricopeptide repeat